MATTDTARARPIHWQDINDLVLDNRYARLPDDFYSRIAPTPVPKPWLVSANADAAALIGLDPGALRSEALLEIAAGNRPLPGGDPLAMVYAGHQFGNYVPRLGDGRAILLGQVRNAQGELWDLHLKGAGRTPYSRWADGRAVLRSCIREYLGGEALHGLGIPTTRALCVVGTELPVKRETVEQGALMLRVARSHVRFGHFEYFFYRQAYERLPLLADAVIEEHFPELAGNPEAYRDWLLTVTERTTALIADWQAVGFVHGVMNTDNFSVLGETIDYGPFAFIDGYQPNFVPNHTDHTGRYAYDRQPAIGKWNVSRLLQATLPLLSEDPQEAVRVATAILERFEPLYQRAYRERMQRKLGLLHQRPGDETLASELQERMAADRADFTRSFRALAALGGKAGDGDAAFFAEFADRDAASGWLAKWRQRLDAEGSQDQERQTRLRHTNPKYVLRSYLAQQAIDQAERGDSGEVDRLLDCLRRPFDERPAYETYAAAPPDCGRGIVLSCSS